MEGLMWTERAVAAHLEDAADIHRRLPRVSVQGYYNLWPETLKDDWERLYDAINGKNRLGPPMPREVTYHETVMAWLRWIDPETQKVVWMKANRIPWKILEDAFGKCTTSLRRQQHDGLGRMSSILSDPSVSAEALRR